MSASNYLARIQGVAMRHLELTLTLDRRWQGQALTTALNGNRLAIAEGWATVSDHLSSYHQMDQVIHGHFGDMSGKRITLS